jgi:polysaccharide biosynthesis/export protein
MKPLLYCLALLLLLASCSRRNLSYFSDLPQQALYQERISNTIDLKIRPDDLISITVTSLNPESNALFNRGEIIPVGNASSYRNVYTAPIAAKEGYLVDREGYISFPVLGRVQLAGLTKAEARTKLMNQLSEYLKEPLVNIQFLNFKVTVVGEVNNPSSFTVPTEKISVLEALGLAGDMTVHGKRENVLVIREADGIRTATRLNLNSMEVFNSPYFYLQQNDVVYVEPDNMKRMQAKTNNRAIALTSSAISLITVLIFRLRLL